MAMLRVYHSKFLTLVWRTRGAKSRARELSLFDGPLLLSLNILVVATYSITHISALSHSCSEFLCYFLLTSCLLSAVASAGGRYRLSDELLFRSLLPATEHPESTTSTCLQYIGRGIGTHYHCRQVLSLFPASVLQPNDT